MAQDKHQSRLKFNVSTFPLQTLPAQRWIFGGHFPALQKKNHSTVNGPFVFGACLAVAQPRTKQLHRWKISQVRLLGIGAYKRLALLKICIRPVICRADPHTPSMRAVVVYSQAKSNYFHIL